MMKYKGYIGSAEISVEDDTLHGKLLHINDLVTYEGTTPAELNAAFHEAVDDYLADCKADGIAPDQPFKGVFNVRVAPALHRKLVLNAQSKSCTLNEYVKVALEAHVDASATAVATTHYHINIGGRSKLCSERWGHSTQLKGERSVSYLVGSTVPSSKTASKCH